MKVLTLTIKQQPFNEILACEKTEEFRELRPTMYCSRYVVYRGDDGKVYKMASQVPAGIDCKPEIVEYDALKLVTGEQKGTRPYLVVEVKSAQIEVITDENDEVITYEKDGMTYAMAQIVYKLGKVLEKYNC